MEDADEPPPDNTPLYQELYELMYGPRGQPLLEVIEEFERLAPEDDEPPFIVPAG